MLTVMRRAPKLYPIGSLNRSSAASEGSGLAWRWALAGERVLADDLHLPRNDAPDQLQCVCNSPTYADLKNCRVCIVSAQLTSPYRRPDFVGRNLFVGCFLFFAVQAGVFQRQGNLPGVKVQQPTLMVAQALPRLSMIEQ